MLTSTPSRSHRSAARTSAIVFAVLLVVGVILAGYGLTHSSATHPHVSATTAATTAAAVTTAARTVAPSPTALPAGVVAFVALPVGTPPSPGSSESVYPWHRLDAALTGPAQVRAGDTVDYRVRLTNRTGEPIPLDPCPAYDLSVGLRTSSYGMNCSGASVAAIAPGDSLSLDLPVYIPRSLSSGTVTDVTWSLGWQPDRGSPQSRLAVTVR